MSRYEDTLCFLIEHGYLENDVVPEILAYVYQKDIRQVTLDILANLAQQEYKY